MKRVSLFWLVSLFLGWVFDFLFWEQMPGINFAVYVMLCLGGGFLVLLSNGLRPSWKSLLLLAPTLFFAVMSAVRREPMSVFLSVVSTLTFLSVLAVTYLGGRWMQYSLADYVVKMLTLAASILARPIIFLWEQKKVAQSEENASQAATGTRSGWKRFWALLRGGLLALPVVAVFAALLSSADLVFAERLQDFLQIFQLERLPEYIFRGVYILVFAYALAGVFLHAGQKSRDEKLLGLEKPFAPLFLGFTEAAVVLGAVNLLFLFFVAIQFRYFFGGETNIGVDGYTYAEYARRGFGELMMVAFFSLILFLGLNAVTKRPATAQRRAFSALGMVLVSLVGVMLVSAFQRLTLYEAVYGFSRLRTYTHVFMIWLGALLVVVAALELLRRERAFALAAVLASIGFVLTLTVMNVDAFIVRQNVARAVQGQDLDVGYLASLSSDATPALVSALLNESLPAETRDAVGAALICQTDFFENFEQSLDWRSFTFSRWWARQALQSVQQELDNYVLLDEDWPLQVESPMGETYRCWSMQY